MSHVGRVPFAPLVVRAVRLFAPFGCPRRSAVRAVRRSRRYFAPFATGKINRDMCADVWCTEFFATFHVVSS